MVRLTPQERRRLPEEEFALPGRRYPIHDRAHAANALTRCKTFCTPDEARTVYSRVCRKFPGIPACKVGFSEWWRGDRYRKPYQLRRRRR